MLGIGGTRVSAVKLEVSYGTSSLGSYVNQLVDALVKANITGRLSIGYPVLADVDQAEIGAVLDSPDHGVILFLFEPNLPSKSSLVIDSQDELIFNFSTHLSRNSELRIGRSLAVPVNAITVTPASPNDDYTTAACINDGDRIATIISNFQRLDPKYRRSLTAALQSVTTIKPRKKRLNALSPRSRGNIIKEIESKIANLDRWQQSAAIECPEGPQRIRGLAGSGKTIVLALKATYMALKNGCVQESG